MDSCSRSDCTNDYLLDGLCEKHYRQTYLAPLEKELANSETIVRTLREQITDRKVMLNRAVKLATGDNRLTHDELNKRIRDRAIAAQHGSIETLKFIRCPRCFAHLANELERIEHDESCVMVVLGKPDRVGAPKRKPQPKKVVVADIDEDAI